MAQSKTRDLTERQLLEYRRFEPPRPQAAAGRGICRVEGIPATPVQLLAYLGRRWYTVTEVDGQAAARCCLQLQRRKEPLRRTNFRQA